MKRLITSFLSLFLWLSLQAQDRPKVALVLGGGGAKGAAAVGVLKYVEESGVPIDMIVGTSIGSIVGGLYSIGYTSAQLDSMFRSQEWLNLLTDRSKPSGSELLVNEDTMTYVMGFPVRVDLGALKDKLNGKTQKDKDGKKKKLFNFGVFKGDSIVSTLERMIGFNDSIVFDSLPIPYRCVAVDVNTFSQVVLSSGNLAQSMRASMAIPFAFRPVQMDGMTLVDGGMLNNLPVDVAKQMGADIVIAIDLTVNKRLDKTGETADTDEFTGEDNLLGTFFQKFNLLSVAAWSLLRPDVKIYQRNLQQVDVYINPNLKGYGPQDFSAQKVSDMIYLGEKAGKSAFKDLKMLKKKLHEY